MTFPSLHVIFLWPLQGTVHLQPPTAVCVYYQERTMQVNHLTVCVHARMHVRTHAHTYILIFSCMCMRLRSHGVYPTFNNMWCGYLYLCVHVHTYIIRNTYLRTYIILYNLPWSFVFNVRIYACMYICVHVRMCATWPIGIIDFEFTALLRSWLAAGSVCFVLLLPTDGQPPSRDFSSFVKKLLQVDPKQRYGDTRGPGQWRRRGCHCCPGGCMYVCTYVCSLTV